MRSKLFRRAAALLLTLVLLLSALPVSALAAAPGQFVLVVEAGGQLVVAPEYVTYTDGQTLQEALAASDHVFDGLEVGWIHAVDNVVGNFTRSDQSGNADLKAAASTVTHFRLSENASSQPSGALMVLMTAMADYLQEPADVRKAASAEYEAACQGFVGASDEAAAELTEMLTDAVAAYEETLTASTVTLRFSGIPDAESIILENRYGKTWENTDGNPTFQVPPGAYDFMASRDGYHVEGHVTVDGNTTVNVSFPEGNWLLQERFRLSEGYGEADFADGEFVLPQWEDRVLTVPVTDTFTGTVYTYAEYDKDTLDIYTPTLTAIYTNTDGVSREEPLGLKSSRSGPTKLLSRGAKGNEVIYRVSFTGEDGFTRSMDYKVVFTRIPTLTGIAVVDQNGRGQAASEKFTDTCLDYTYKVLADVTALTLTPRPLMADYELEVNGEPVENGSATVTLDPDAAQTEIQVRVSCQGASSTYTLTVLPGEGKTVSLKTTASNVELVVVNGEGVELPYEKFIEGDGFNRYRYTLVPNETYHYIATRDTYYHAEDDFNLSDAANSTITVSVPAEDWLSGLALGPYETTGFKGTLELLEDFDPADHSYAASLADSASAVYAWVDVADAVSADVKVEALYDQIDYRGQYHGKPVVIPLRDGNEKGIALSRVLLKETPYENAVTFRLSKQVGGITHYQDYVVELQRELTLKNLTARYGEETVQLNREDGNTGYDPQIREYTVRVAMAAAALEIFPAKYDLEAEDGGKVCYGEAEAGYLVTVNGEAVSGLEPVSVPLTGNMEQEEITITVTNEKTPGLSGQYIIHVLKAAPTVVHLTMNPADALLCAHEVKSGNRIWPTEDGTLQLSEGFSYTYNLTAKGYVGQTGTLSVAQDAETGLVLYHNDQPIQVEMSEDKTSGQASLILTLEKAKENTSIDPDIPSQWSDFRGTPDNNAVTDAPIPVTAESGMLSWATKLGEGFGADAVGCPILVDGDLITYSGDTIYRVDAVSGEILATGQMDHNSSYSITTPTYYQGMVFVALSEGVVQAFHADTLESLWIYRDPLEGQPNSPLTVRDGYLYTGFWNNENNDANFVCLSVTDEDPGNKMEEKLASWYYTQHGGFYWAGAYAGDGFVLVGTDDGRPGYTSRTSRLLLFESRTGRLLDSWENLNGDIRSSIAYDDTTKAYYFTAKGGTFYSVKVTDGRLTDKWYVNLSNGFSGGTPMSTSTPTVCNGRAYVGVSGVGQFTPYSGHNITVIDLGRRAIAYQAATEGYPQTSGLLTTAYASAAQGGYLYVYFFDNQSPGKLRVLRDKPGQTAAEYTTMENGTKTAYALFTPVDDHAEYAICSPIVDEYGTIYFKNDSANLMAFGSTIQRLEVTKMPDKQIYAAGETFDPAGMAVTAVYSNGKTRDVTEYVTWNQDALTETDSMITVVFPYAKYRNAEDGQTMTAGNVVPAPTAQIPIQVGQMDDATAMKDIGISGDTVTVTLNGMPKENGAVPKDWSVVVGMYDENGKLVGVDMVPCTGWSVTLTLEGADEAYELRAFVMDGGSRPVWDHLSTRNKEAKQ